MGLMMHHQAPFTHSAQDPAFKKKFGQKAAPPSPCTPQESCPGLIALHSFLPFVAVLAAFAQQRYQGFGGTDTQADKKVNCWNSCDMKHARGSKAMKACQRACHLDEKYELVQHKGDKGAADKNEYEDPDGENENMHHEAPFSRKAEDPAFAKDMPQMSTHTTRDE